MMGPPPTGVTAGVNMSNMFSALTQQMAQGGATAAPPVANFMGGAFGAAAAAGGVNPAAPAANPTAVGQGDNDDGSGSSSSSSSSHDGDGYTIRGADGQKVE